MSTTANPASAGAMRSPVLDDRSLLGHPKGLGLLFVVEMWERFSYYGMRALLVLYLVNYLGWSDGRAADLYGTYTALVYLTPLIGGYLADRFIGTNRSLVIGGLIITAGHFALAMQTMATFYAGLGLVIIGTGFFKPNVSTMVGQIYPEGDPRRDGGFTIFYMGINLGAFLAPLVCSYLGEKVGWHYGFGAAGVGMLIGLIIYVWGRNKWLPGIGTIGGRTAEAPATEAGAVAAMSETHAVKHGIIGGAAGLLVTVVSAVLGGILPLIIGAAIGVAAVVANAGKGEEKARVSDMILVAVIFGSLAGLVQAYGWIGYPMGPLIGAALLVTLLGTGGEDRNRVTAIFVVVFAVVFFWAAFELAGSAMNLFADRYVDRTLGGRLADPFPAGWFQSVNAGFILIFAIPFAMLWQKLGGMGKDPPTALKMVIGLFLLGLGFVFMVMGGRAVDGGAIVSPLWLVMAYLLHTWGELCLSPVGLSYVTKVAPWKFASLLMGVWFLANAAANKLSGVIAGMTEQITSQGTFYLIPLGMSMGAGLILLMLVPWLRGLTKTVKA